MEGLGDLHRTYMDLKLRSTAFVHRLPPFFVLSAHGTVILSEASKWVLRIGIKANGLSVWLKLDR